MGTVCFSVTGDGLTNIVRDLWVSGKYQNAINAIHYDPVDKDMCEKIICGKLRFEGDTREGDHCLDIVDDNVTEYKGCELKSFENALAYEKYKFFEALTNYAEYRKLYRNAVTYDRMEGYSFLLIPAEKELRLRTENVNYISSFINNYTINFEFLTACLDECAGKLPAGISYNSRDRSQAEYFEQPKRAAQYEKYKYGPQTTQQFPTQVPTSNLLNDLLDKVGISESERPTVESVMGEVVPEICNVNDTKWKSGWIARNGDFWGCKYMQHKPLLQAMFDKNITTTPHEKEIEEKAWIKISDTRIYCYPVEHGKRLTKSQRNALEDFILARKQIHVIFNENYYKVPDFLEKIS